MKILQITPFFYPSIAGMETYALNLSRCLSQRGHQIDVLTVNTENALEEETLYEWVRVYRYKYSLRYRQFYTSLQLATEILKAKDYDLYHIHLPFPFTLEIAISASKINRIPLIVSYQCEGTQNTPGLIYFVMKRLYSLYSEFTRRVTLGYAGKIIFLTQSYAESLRFSKKVRDRIRIVRPGVDIQRFSPLNDGSKLRSEYGFSSNDRIVLFVGSLKKSHRYKNVDNLIKALAFIKTQIEDTKLVIVGSGDLIVELKDLADELHLGNDVIFTGFIPDEQLHSYYAMCDIFVLPSFSETEAFGLVLLEAMASGKTCIASNIPGVRDVIKNGQTGLLIPPGDTKVLSQAIMHLAKDDILRKEMSQNARKDVENYTWEKCAEEIESIYREITAPDNST